MVESDLGNYTSSSKLRSGNSENKKIKCLTVIFLKKSLAAGSTSSTIAPQVALPKAAS